MKGGDAVILISFTIFAWLCCVSFETKVVETELLFGPTNERLSYMGGFFCFWDSTHFQYLQFL
ncbi:hypothetical protein SB49_10030 [Sediminicola sp. YIK13]|nr:hypothetical protein SB49_10030 [Sediminicola sp. YIK13]